MSEKEALKFVLHSLVFKFFRLFRQFRYNRLNLD